MRSDSPKILSQGEVIANPEHHRMVAKKAWLQLWEYLMMNNELLRARTIPVPWDLMTDQDVLTAIQEVNNHVRRFRGVEDFCSFIWSSGILPEIDILRSLWASGDNTERTKWIIQEACAENPETILSLGFSSPAITLLLGKNNRQVTTVVPVETYAEELNELAVKEKLPVQFVHGLFPEVDFGGRQFDVVLLCDLLEYVYDEIGVLQKACELARKCIIVTTPFGSPTAGSYRDAQWRRGLIRVRSHSEISFRRLLSVADKFELAVDLTILQETQDVTPYDCFGARLYRKEVTVVNPIVPTATAENGGEVVRPAHAPNRGQQPAKITGRPVGE